MKLVVQNTFYTKCINAIFDSIGPSIILRSIHTVYGPSTRENLSFWFPTKRDLNPSLQLQRLARNLKFRF